MGSDVRVRAPRLAVLALLAATGCGSPTTRLAPAETFHWVAQPIAFSPPPARWERQGDNGGGLLGVRFILRGGGGQCISVYAHRQLAERDRREAIARLIARRDSLERREFLNELALVRPRTEDPISPREAVTAQAINDAVDRATRDVLEDQPGFVAADLDAALRAAASYEPTLAELLPHIRLMPERMQESWRWRIARERDTTIAGQPAFASDDTLITPERPLLYREIFWVVNGCAFKAVYQGTDENLRTFAQVVDSIRFPVGNDVAAD
jgi:hypothetical protein